MPDWDEYDSTKACLCNEFNSKHVLLLGQTALEVIFKRLAVMMLLLSVRVDLSAHGFYKTPDVTGFGGALPFNYFTFGASCSEVELDTLTGGFI